MKSGGVFLCTTKKNPPAAAKKQKKTYLKRAYLGSQKSVHVTQMCTGSENRVRAPLLRSCIESENCSKIKCVLKAALEWRIERN